MIVCLLVPLSHLLKKCFAGFFLQMARQMKNGRTARAVRKGGDFAAHNLIATWEGGDFAAHKSIAAMLIGFRGIGVALVSPIGI